MRFAATFALVLLGVLVAQDQRSWASGPTVSDSFMVSTANPLASKAARAIIRAGGNAVDAAIAAQMVLGLVEPQSSGIGGGAFMLYYDAADRTVTSYDGRETAPMAATPDLFMLSDGEPMAWTRAAEGGLPVGAPGTLRMLEMAHAEHGRLPWADLFAMSQRVFEIMPYRGEPAIGMTSHLGKRSVVSRATTFSSSRRPDRARRSPSASRSPT